MLVMNFYCMRITIVLPASECGRRIEAITRQIGRIWPTRGRLCGRRVADARPTRGRRAAEARLTNFGRSIADDYERIMRRPRVGRICDKDKKCIMPLIVGRNASAACRPHHRPHAADLASDHSDHSDAAAAMRPTMHRHLYSCT